jgi:membrane dipeptidase
MIGIRFSFLRRDGLHDVDTPIELVIKHLEHILEHVREDGVGFGSGFDGAKIPAAIAR